MVSIATPSRAMVATAWPLGLAAPAACATANPPIECPIRTGGVAKVLGIPSSNVSNWVRLDAKGQLGGVVPSQKAPVVTAEQMELARLRAEVARLKMERDIAKKAAAYFAQDVLQSTLGSGK